MERLVNTDGTEKIVKALVFHRIRAAARRDTADLTTAIAAQLAALREAEAGATEADELHRAAMAEIQFLLSELDDAVRAAEAAAVALAKRKKTDPAYRKLFGEYSLTRLLRLPLDEKPIAVRSLLHAMSDGTLSEPKGVIAAALEQLDAAIENRDALALGASTAGADLKAAKEAACAVYNDHFHTLSLRFPGRRALVESFFRSSRRSQPAGRSKRPANDGQASAAQPA